MRGERAQAWRVVRDDNIRRGLCSEFLALDSAAGLGAIAIRRVVRSVPHDPHKAAKAFALKMPGRSYFDGFDFRKQRLSLPPKFTQSWVLRGCWICLVERW